MGPRTFMALPFLLALASGAGVACRSRPSATAGATDASSDANANAGMIGVNYFAGTRLLVMTRDRRS
jgi:hypothetical protein